MNNSYDNDHNTSKATKLIVAGVAVVAVLVAASYLIDVDQTKETVLPQVDVDVEAGQLPEFDVDIADIEISTKEVVVEVPAVDVQTKTVELEVPVDADLDTDEVTVNVPTISIEPPAEDSLDE